MIRVSLFIATIFSSVLASAKPSLVCNLNKSESYVIDPQKQTVTYSFFNREETPLTLESFYVARCPYCFLFKGALNGKTLEGQTRTDGAPGSPQFLVSLDLKVDGAKPGMSIPCSPIN